MAKTIIYNWKLAYKKLIIKAKKLGYVVGELRKAPANVSDHANMLTKQIIILLHMSGIVILNKFLFQFTQN
jgi:hypothetical protein